MASKRLRVVVARLGVRACRRWWPCSVDTRGEQIRRVQAAAVMILQVEFVAGGESAAVAGSADDRSAALPALPGARRHRSSPPPLVVVFARIVVDLLGILRRSHWPAGWCSASRSCNRCSVTLPVAARTSCSSSVTTSSSQAEVAIARYIGPALLPGTGIAAGHLVREDQRCVCPWCARSNRRCLLPRSRRRDEIHTGFAILHAVFARRIGPVRLRREIR